MEKALAEVPKKFKKYIKNVTFIVEEKPCREVFPGARISPYSSVLGLYHGVPFKHRGPYYGNLPPDVIVIYKKPIESICSSEEELKEKVREVVFHEIGHYFGLSEEELREIEDKE